MAAGGDPGIADHRQRHPRQLEHPVDVERVPLAQRDQLGFVPVFDRVATDGAVHSAETVRDAGGGRIEEAVEHPPAAPRDVVNRPGAEQETSRFDVAVLGHPHEERCVDADTERGDGGRVRVEPGARAEVDRVPEPHPQSGRAHIRGARFRKCEPGHGADDTHNRTTPGRR
ncbi:MULTISPECIES: hypothetical protein [Nocardia]|uniref:hypothetical protein n=1 Tax=Nocardia TaxID=1817 RepID=UPI001E59F585|nr:MULTISPECIES: hypothetical protein [Nocardia]UEX24254.1 hypothetical protein LMJ57_07255 [Nocardia farcinica]